jgi:hypothetical protein
MARTEAMKRMCKCHRIVYLEQIYGSLPSIFVDFLLALRNSRSILGGIAISLAM